MSFETLLEELVRNIEDARGAIFLDAQGEAVQWFALEDTDGLRLRAAYMAAPVQSIRASSSRLELGRLSHFIIRYDGAWIILAELEDGYFLMLELNSSANLGMAIERLQPAIVSLRKETAA